MITHCCLFCTPLIIFPHSARSDALFRNGRVMAKLKPNTFSLNEKFNSLNSSESLEHFIVI